MAWTNNGAWENTSVGNNLHVYLIEIIGAIAERLAIASYDTFDIDDAFPDGLYLTPISGKVNVPVLEDFDFQVLEQEWGIGSPLSPPSANLLFQIQRHIALRFFSNTQGQLDGDGVSWPESGPGPSPTSGSWFLRWMTEDGGTVAYTEPSLITAAGFGDDWLLFDESTKDPKPLLQLKAIMDLLVFPEWNIGFDGSTETSFPFAKMNVNVSSVQSNIESIVWSNPGAPGNLIITTNTPHEYDDNDTRVIHIWRSSDNSVHRERIITPISSTQFRLVGSSEGDTEIGWDRHHSIDVDTVFDNIDTVVLEDDGSTVTFTSVHPFTTGDVGTFWFTGGIQSGSFVVDVVDPTTIRIEGTEISVFANRYRRFEESDWNASWVDLLGAVAHVDYVDSYGLADLSSKCFVQAWHHPEATLGPFSIFWLDGVGLFWNVQIQEQDYFTEQIKGTLTRGVRAYKTSLFGQSDGPDDFDVTDMTFQNTTTGDVFGLTGGVTHSTPEEEITEAGPLNGWPNVDGTNTPGAILKFAPGGAPPFVWGSVSNLRQRVSSRIDAEVLSIGNADSGEGSRAYTDLTSILTFVT